MYYATDTSHSGVSAEKNSWLVTNKCSAARDFFLFVCPCFTLPFTVSAVKCQTVCDLPTGAVHAIQRALRTFAHKLWVGRETSDNMHLLGEPLSAVILRRTDYCHAGCATHAKQWEKRRHLALIWTNVWRVCWLTSPNERPSYVWFSGCSELRVMQWLISREHGAQQQSSGQLSPLSYPFR